MLTTGSLDDCDPSAAAASHAPIAFELAFRVQWPPPRLPPFSHWDADNSRDVAHPDKFFRWRYPGGKQETGYADNSHPRWVDALIVLLPFPMSLHTGPPYVAPGAAIVLRKVETGQALITIPLSTASFGEFLGSRLTVGP